MSIPPKFGGIFIVASFAAFPAYSVDGAIKSFLIIATIAEVGRFMVAPIAFTNAGFGRSVVGTNFVNAFLAAVHQFATE